MSQSHPAWDAWIEIAEAAKSTYSDLKSHLAWDAWIEIYGMVFI